MTPTSSDDVVNGDVRQLTELVALDAKVNALLPPRYQACFDTVNPKLMGLAALKYCVYNDSRCTCGYNTPPHSGLKTANVND